MFGGKLESLRMAHMWFMIVLCRRSAFPFLADVCGADSKAQASVLMQLHTGHVPLNYFLHKINKVESPVCPICWLADKTIHHYLLDCLRHAYEHHGLGWAMGQNSRSIWHLLGTWHAYKLVLTYVCATGRFKSIYGDLPMPLTQADNSLP